MKDREQTIAWVMGYCQHYTPDTIFGRGLRDKGTGLCAAGVRVDDVRVPNEGMKPCIDGHELPDVLAVCPKWLRKTRGQGIERHERVTASMERMTKVGPVVAEWRKQKPRGKQAVIECPTECGGKLHLSQAANNGHVWGRCTTAGCVNWME